MKRAFLGGAALSVLLASPAMAHTGLGGVSGFGHGFFHPIGGLDHILAMVAVGVLAAQQGGRALWAIPLAFVAMMAVGGALGMAGVAVPFVEQGIVGSVIILGGVVALGRRMPVAAAMAMVGLFAIFHGHAHGAEMPVDAAGLEYGLGFMAATALLHMSGIALTVAVQKAVAQSAPLAARIGGALIAMAGLGLAVS